MANTKEESNRNDQTKKTRNSNLPENPPGVEQTDREALEKAFKWAKGLVDAGVLEWKGLKDEPEMARPRNRKNNGARTDQAGGDGAG